NATIQNFDVLPGRKQRLFKPCSDGVLFLNSPSESDRSSKKEYAGGWLRLPAPAAAKPPFVCSNGNRLQQGGVVFDMLVTKHWILAGEFQCLGVSPHLDV